MEDDPDFQKYRTELEMLSLHMGDLPSCLARSHVSCSALSTMELRVATFINNSLNSLQMAGQSDLSLDTIKTHRRNIRKKSASGTPSPTWPPSFSRDGSPSIRPVLREQYRIQAS